MGKWKPDYKGWLKWSDGLYSPDATIMAIGDFAQKFHDNQKGMKYQRDAFEMEMGSIMQMVVEDNVAALIYHMYLTPKNVDNAPIYDMIITEYKTFDEIDGILMLTRLDLYADGGDMAKK